MKIKKCKRGLFEGEFLEYIGTGPCRCKDSTICRYGGECETEDYEAIPAAEYDAQQAAIAAAEAETEKARAMLKEAMLSGDIPTTSNTYTLVNVDLNLCAALARLRAAQKVNEEAE